MNYTMREVTAGDVPAVTRMISERSTWLAERGKVSFGQDDELAGLLRRPDAVADGAVLGLFSSSGSAVGCCVVLPGGDGGVPAGWTAEERRERTWTVAMCHTHPAVRADRTGWLMSMWISDCAARQPDPPAWLRCAVPGRVLARHYRDTLGWCPVRTVQDPDLGHVTLMQCRPRTSSGVSVLVSGPALVFEEVPCGS